MQKAIILLIGILLITGFTAGCISSTEEDNTDNRTVDIIGNTEKNDSINNETVLASVQDETENYQNTTIGQAPVPEPSVVDIDNLRIGAFNIQVFGVTKASKPEVMEVLAEIIRTYDIVAIQEIRDASQTALPSLVELVNSDDHEYSYVVSERLGRTSSKEQYAYIFNTQTVQIDGEPQTYPEPEDTDPFHREPYIMAFSSVTGNFDAVMMVIHTDPDEATEEINYLDDALSYAQELYPDEEDFMILGDLNADGSYFDEDGTSDLDAYQWIISDDLDTTTKTTNRTYDRIILTDTSDFTGDAGVFRYDTEYGLDYEQTIAVSDHYPVYAEFIITNDNDRNVSSVV
ncbi:endonuclease/exonuclease/phosphatase family protein [Methanolobus profundi]|uniref:Metal-dependent hydrolase, endonuclease/exonuclease/phosphatase family n=1 Tax=Methanolobus profundi TaxID=487685 RepID=A0A1I4PBF8_9EURY|nr:endonuclease/exonuclease/phosphatase family protein [Methanolobus profundi]SFM25059.1 Metal-dependent hydrolase, endonuclease/exonuclease/phosphatase family [Methanolobus profundi]